jgi:hypothetical protein
MYAQYIMLPVFEEMDSTDYFRCVADDIDAGALN